ncbi:8-amino-7-oxononanoate synthase [Candidatus Hakubella thermalkaliphila]|uniref:8-amino-7-oxononanoate synthase n=1 Tax=Candidatus Hakubella thermalkaliphila TaxID=2754717 RepID=A0A6V8NZA3_9ACTN|nr:8-amino-7-oxononanoate synthase [Candidatus Hakubella thermalkaliphila]GFP25598.1 glycine C-acetyltransferase [Candidatus Hakubella thermalkaliphila]GFP27639.1 glycine C-acetyltransferase [Candidatus Hakubella thermalkaliphila]
MAEQLDERMKPFLQRLEKLKASDHYFYLQSIAGPTEPRVKVNGRGDMIMLASYSYLGLASHPKIRAAAIEAMERYGVGAGGVRLLAGTTELHRELEERIAEFKNTEAATLFSSGYVTNMSTISSLFGRGDVIIMDKLDHASIIDGCLLSGAQFRTYRHNDMEHLESILKKSQNFNTRLIVADAVFSMDGDIADLPGIVELAKKYDALVMIDEAHSLGVLGASGRGIDEHFGLEDAVDIKMGTLSKAIPSIGGYIAGERRIIDYLQHNARAFIFSASLPPASVAVALTALEIIQEEPWRLVNLRRNTDLFREGLRKLGFDTMQSTTPIIPVLIGKEWKSLELTRLLFEEGVFVCPILYPAVPKNTDRLRTHVMATHSETDLKEALDAFRRAGEALGLIRTHSLDP